MRLSGGLVEVGLIIVNCGVLAAALDAIPVPLTTPIVLHATPGAGTNLPGVDGEYFMGDGLGRNLRLSILPDGRYSFVSSGCTGVHFREFGNVRQTEGRYVLSPSGRANRW